jgi:sigma-B regulation protein RsbU (phosphoserine phosphatase)
MICRDCAILNLDASGLPVGLLERAEYDEIQFSAQPGDVILLYSDGVSDQTNEAGQLYGEQRLARYFTSITELPASELATALLDDIIRFRGDTPVHDDQTVIVLKVH